GKGGIRRTTTGEKTVVVSAFGRSHRRLAKCASARRRTRCTTSAAMSSKRALRRASVRTHSLATPTGLLRKIQRDLDKLQGIENSELSGITHDGRRVVLPPGNIQTKGLLVGIPENQRQFLTHDLREQLSTTARRAQTIIRVAPVRNWRR